MFIHLTTIGNWTTVSQIMISTLTNLTVESSVPGPSDRIHLNRLTYQLIPQKPSHSEWEQNNSKLLQSILYPSPRRQLVGQVRRFPSVLTPHENIIDNTANRTGSSKPNLAYSLSPDPFTNSDVS